MELKTCTVCAESKPLDRFSPRRDRKGVLRTMCKECAVQRVTQFRRDNPAFSAFTQGYINARKRAERKHLDFSLNRDLLRKRYESGVCEITGIPFAYNPGEQWRRPSLDRIDNSRGYTEDNVRLVLFAVNSLLGSWGEDAAITVAKAFLQRRDYGNHNQRGLE